MTNRHMFPVLWLGFYCGPLLCKRVRIWVLWELRGALRPPLVLLNPSRELLSF